MGKGVEMARNIYVEEYVGVPIAEQKMEIVERKGIGHPDTICDSIMEALSIELSREYLKRFGRIYHYNVDKGMLVAGRSEKVFGGGRVTEPMLLIFGDRATRYIGGDEVPIDEIAVETAKRWLRENLRYVDPDEHVKYQVEIKEGSEELKDIFERGEEILGANDTSAAVGYAPLSPLEKAVLDLERYMNSREFKKRFPETGEDIKVMGLRLTDRVVFTVAMSFVDRHIESVSDYFRKKSEVLDDVREYLRGKIDMEFKIDINTLDDPSRGMGGIYLTVTGTSAEDADCGEVGRGNRVNGVIPLNRPVSNEAAAGKNPVSHVGKIYNILSHRLAERIYSEVSGIREVYVWLLSQIGRPIDDPLATTVEVKLEKGVKLSDVREKIADIVDQQLSRISEFCMELALGKHRVC